MIQLYQDIMNIRNIDSTNFQAKFRFANTRPKPPTLKDVLCDKMTNPCKNTLKGMKSLGAIIFLPKIISRIKTIKNSIKKPS